MKKISVSAMTDLFAAIEKTNALYLPLEKAGEIDYGRYTADAVVRLDQLHTVKSAKDLFFPQSENLMNFAMEGKKITIDATEPSTEKFVVMGVRACDARSFTILDKVFLSEPVDGYYAARRANGVVVTAACSMPEETCFCKLFGIDAAEPEGDVVTWTVGEELYWDARTEKGRALTDSMADVFTDADDQPVKAQQKQVREIIEKLPFVHLDLSGFTEDKLKEKFDSPVWKSLSEACLGCGTCTFVCPTCQCYDVRDYDTGHGIQRYRCWDSCMYSDFTLMAGGTPRPTQLEKFRQRFMHKLVYFPANNDGQFGCVGCGRCLIKCPISMNIVKVIKALGGNEK